MGTEVSERKNEVSEINDMGRNPICIEKDGNFGEELMDGITEAVSEREIGSKESISVQEEKQEFIVSFPDQVGLVKELDGGEGVKLDSNSVEYQTTSECVHLQREVESDSAKVTELNVEEDVSRNEEEEKEGFEVAESNSMEIDNAPNEDTQVAEVVEGGEIGKMGNEEFLEVRELVSGPHALDESSSPLEKNQEYQAIDGSEEALEVSEPSVLDRNPIFTEKNGSLESHTVNESREFSPNENLSDKENVPVQLKDDNVTAETVSTEGSILIAEPLMDKNFDSVVLVSEDHELRYKELDGELNSGVEATDNHAPEEEWHQSGGPIGSELIIKPSVEQNQLVGGEAAPMGNEEASNAKDGVLGINFVDGNASFPENDQDAVTSLNLVQDPINGACTKVDSSLTGMDVDEAQAMGEFSLLLDKYEPHSGQDTETFGLSGVQSHVNVLDEESNMATHVPEVDAFGKVVEEAISPTDNPHGKGDDIKEMECDMGFSLDCLDEDQIDAGGDAGECGNNKVEMGEQVAGFEEQALRIEVKQKNQDITYRKRKQILEDNLSITRDEKSLLELMAQKNDSHDFAAPMKRVIQIDSDEQAEDKNRDKNEKTAFKTSRAEKDDMPHQLVVSKEQNIENDQPLPKKPSPKTPRRTVEIIDLENYSSSRKRKGELLKTPTNKDSNQLINVDQGHGRNHPLATAGLLLTFAEPYSVPSKANLNKIFRRFGPLKESETEIERETNSARVVFRTQTDAEVAYSSAGKFSIFGQASVSYQLSHSSLTLSKDSLSVTPQGTKAAMAEQNKI